MAERVGARESESTEEGKHKRSLQLREVDSSPIRSQSIGEGPLARGMRSDSLANERCIVARRESYVLIVRLRARRSRSCVASVPHPIETILRGREAESSRSLSENIRGKSDDAIRLENRSNEALVVQISQARGRDRITFPMSHVPAFRDHMRQYVDYLSENEASKKRGSPFVRCAKHIPRSRIFRNTRRRRLETVGIR